MADVAGLFAQNQRVKRAKCESRRVNTPRSKIALKSDLWEEYQVQPHPYLKGVKCREDGCIFVPASGTNKAHWTYGTRTPKGYLQVAISRKTRAVHRLMAETFLQCPIPAGMQIDHIDRCPSNNKLANIRIVTPSENQRNRESHDRVESRGCTHSYEDSRRYNKERYNRRRKYRTAVIMADSKIHWVPTAIADRLLRLPVKQRVLSEQKED